MKDYSEKQLAAQTQVNKRHNIDKDFLNKFLNFSRTAFVQLQQVKKDLAANN